MSTLAETMEKTTRAFLQDYVDASKGKNMDLISAHLTDDCRRYVGPGPFLRSKGAPEDFSMGNAEYQQEFNDMSLYEFDEHRVYHLVIDAPNLKAAARSEIFARFYADNVTGSRNFCWFLDFNEDGTKIRKCFQQVDTEEANNWMKEIKVRKSST